MQTVKYLTDRRVIAVFKHPLDQEKEQAAKTDRLAQQKLRPAWCNAKSRQPVRVWSPKP